MSQWIVRVKDMFCIPVDDVVLKFESIVKRTVSKEEVSELLELLWRVCIIVHTVFAALILKYSSLNDIVM